MRSIEPSVEDLTDPGVGAMYGTGDLARMLGGSEDSWTGDLVNLIAKSDPPHKAALRAAFPMHVAAYEAWMDASPPTFENVLELLRRRVNA